MIYKGFKIEFNQDSKRGLDYKFYDADDWPVGYGRSIANVKNQIDVILSK